MMQPTISRLILLSAILTLSACNPPENHTSSEDLLEIENWSLSEETAGFFLVYEPNPAIREEIEMQSGGPAIEEIRILGDDSRFAVVIYYSGSAGTQVIVDLHRAVLLDRENGTTLGDYPWAYESDTDFPQPQWAISEDGTAVTVLDENTGEEFLIRAENGP